jgi:hypothetical protein
MPNIEIHGETFAPTIAKGAIAKRLHGTMFAKDVIVRALQRGSNPFYPKLMMRKRWCRGVWGEAVAPFLSCSYFDIP